jgi:hypothetical protein
MQTNAGKVISFGLFLSPLPTFVQIIKKRDVERYVPGDAPQLRPVGVLRAPRGPPQQHILVVTINGAGLAIEVVYLSIFFNSPTPPSPSASRCSPWSSSSWPASSSAPTPTRSGRSSWAESASSLGRAAHHHKARAWSTCPLRCPWSACSTPSAGRHTRSYDSTSS